MAAVVADFEIVGTVIQLVPVDVVDDFGIQQGASDLSLHDESMLEHVSARQCVRMADWCSDESIPAGTGGSAAFPARISFISVGVTGDKARCTTCSDAPLGRVTGRK